MTRATEEHTTQVRSQSSASRTIARSPSQAAVIDGIGVSSILMSFRACVTVKFSTHLLRAPGGSALPMPRFEHSGSSSDKDLRWALCSFVRWKWLPLRLLASLSLLVPVAARFAGINRSTPCVHCPPADYYRQHWTTRRKASSQRFASHCYSVSNFLPLLTPRFLLANSIDSFIEAVTGQSTSSKVDV